MTPYKMSGSAPPAGGNRPATAHTSTLADTLIAAAAGVATLVVYLRTIYPDVLAIGDATKFAFVGKVLGIPHAPGYPLYVLVSHLFSYLPFGTLAYRMNVMSATFGAVAVALGYLIARRLHVCRPIAIATALGLGLGQSFWATALYAKTYTLHATLISLGVLILLRWEQERRVGDFYLAVAIFALSAGNHLTVIALLPALVLFGLMTDARTALRPKTIAIVVLLVALGLSQYLLILIRTLQNAPYVEAKASNLSQLWAVMTARRFAHEIGAYPASALLTTRIPIVSRLFGTEFGWLGLPLLAAGLAVMAVRRPRAALLLGLGGFCIGALTANMSSEEDRGFLLAAFALLWPIAGVGLQWLVTSGQSHSRRLATALMLCAVIALPYSQLSGNYRINDHHTETFERDYFNALFAALPPKAAIVNDEYRLNMLVLYELLGERAARGRDIRLVPLNKDAIRQLQESGFEVFAFQHAKDTLATFTFDFARYDFPTDKGVASVLRQRDIFRVMSTASCVGVGNSGWVDLGNIARPAGRLSVKIDNFRPFDSELTVYAGSAQPLSPEVFAPHGPGTPVLKAERFQSSRTEDRQRLMERASADRVELPDAISGAAFITRAAVQVNDKGDYSAFALDLGGETAAILASARVDQDAPHRATLCTHPLANADALPPEAATASFPPDDRALLFDDGWYPIERRGDGYAYRWMGSRSVVLLPLSHPRAAELSIDVEPLDYAGRVGDLTITINGHRFPAQRVARGRSTLSWNVPLADWHQGLNDLVFEITGAKTPAELGLSTDGRLLGASVSRVAIAALKPS